MIDWKLVDHAALLAVHFDRITIGRVSNFEDRFIVRLYLSGKEMACFQTGPLACGEEFEIPMRGSMPLTIETRT